MDKPFEFHWPKEPIRALGIFISHYQKRNEGKKFKAKVGKLSTILDILQSCSLIQGKVQFLTFQSSKSTTLKTPLV